MASALDKLLEIAGDGLGTGPATNRSAFPEWPGMADLLDLLSRRDGFFAFEGALLVRPLHTSGGVLGLSDWNSPENWIDAYQGMADDAFFFADDLFGGQFCIRADGIYSFEPEGGQFEFVASSLEGWAQAVLDDYDVLTGASLAHEWQTAHGKLPSAARLLPKKPFIAGGDFTSDNLYALDAMEGMKFRASIAVQVRDLPDGAQIQFEVVD
jgi:hypothetical protein